MLLEKQREAPEQTRPEALNKVLAILAARGLLTRTTYNAAKTDIIIFGETPQDRLHRKLCQHLKPRFFMTGEPLTSINDRELRLLHRCHSG